MINAADYLVDGTPHVPDANGDWFGTWAFYADASKTVYCSMTTFSADAGGVDCGMVPGKTALATYAIPPGASNHCDPGASNAADGYSLDAGEPSLGPDVYAGFAGCATADPDVLTQLSKTKVLPNGATLKVETFTCTVVSAVATCTDTGLWQGHTGTITFGLHVATFSQT